MRGRVGRSHIQSHAYFFVNGLKTISNDARQRLEILTTHNDLGMGFKIAQYDLELRGAGNILGSDQSGRINDIGYELDMNLLKDEVEQQRGAQSKSMTYVQAELNLKIDARIPESFVKSESERLKLYRDLFRVNSTDRLTELEATTADTYGKLPEAFKKLFSLARVKLLASELGIKQINSKKDIEFIFDSLSKETISKILSVAKVMKNVEITSDFRLKILDDRKNDDIILLDTIFSVLTKITKG